MSEFLFGIGVTSPLRAVPPTILHVPFMILLVYPLRVSDVWRRNIMTMSRRWRVERPDEPIDEHSNMYDSVEDPIPYRVLLLSWVNTLAQLWSFSTVTP